MWPSIVPLQVLHAIDHVFRSDAAEQAGQSADLLADRTALIRNDNNPTMVKSLRETLL
jgi:hypothetical protein